MTPSAALLGVPAVPGAGLPPELVFVLEPRASTVSARAIWLRRLLALGGAAFLTALFMGPCMRT